MRKPTILIPTRSDINHGCTITEEGYKLEVSDIRRRRNGTIRIAQTKALISFAVTAKLICAFVFAYADCLFSHAASQL